ncbi:MAG TPA: CBS domain-containing protein [Caldisericia bacterium]|nr:CBS domain-containing protein [Caldisericia bacterium]
MALLLNLPVRDIMKKDCISIQQNALVEEAAALMVKHRINGIPVLNEKGEVIGMITQGDLVIRATGIRLFTLWPYGSYESNEEMMKEYHKIIGTKVSEVMNDQPITIDPDRPISYAAELMYKKRIKQLPVVENNKLIGFISRTDIIDLIFRKED